METDLTLKEKYLLLCYHPEKGRLLNSANYASYGVAGAIMLELAELGKFEVQNNRVVLSDSKATGERALDLVIQRIAKARRHRKVSAWISSIAQSGRMQKIKAAIRESLIKKHIMKKQEKTALLIFKYNRYPLHNARLRRQIISEIHNVVINRKIGNKGIMILTALIGATRMERSFFIRDERKAAKKRIKEIMKNNEIAKMLDSTVSAVQAAVVTAITTSVVISAATASSN